MVKQNIKIYVWNVNLVRTIFYQAMAKNYNIFYNIVIFFIAMIYPFLYDFNFLKDFMAIKMMAKLLIRDFPLQLVVLS